MGILHKFDTLIVISFFIILFIIGFVTKTKKNSKSDFLAGSQKMGYILFVATTVATWYGGILGIGEFTYSFGIISWFTQGIPYYFFAILFAFVFSKKIRKASLLTIPQKIKLEYGEKSSKIAAFLIYLLVNPAPYLLMLSTLFAHLFNFNEIYGVIISIIIVGGFLIKGGFRTTINTDLFQFILMFLGFGMMFLFLFANYGNFSFLIQNLPKNHLSLENVSPTYLFVWFLIALWTFVDPGFHQRSTNAINEKIAKWGIIISVGFWAIFDLLTTTSGLFARVILDENINPILAFPLLADKILPIGLKGIFYVGLFATILSTFNSITFLSGLTFANDLFSTKNEDEKSLIFRTRLGIAISLIIAFIVSIYFKSIIQIWYVIGSIIIPGLILPVFSTYFPKIRISEKYLNLQMILSPLIAIIWQILKPQLNLSVIITEISEPMLVGLLVSIIIQFIGMKSRKT